MVAVVVVVMAVVSILFKFLVVGDQPAEMGDLCMEYHLFILLFFILFLKYCFLFFEELKYCFLSWILMPFV